MKNQNGITLIELILALAIVLILIGTGIPTLNEQVEKNRIISEVNKLYSTLQYGRISAIETQEKVTICPTNDGKECSKDWSAGYIVFVDKNNDRNINGDESLLKHYSIENELITLRLAAFGIRSSMQWLETGITNHQNGYFEFCYRERPKLARALIISKAGRIRHSKDTNGNEIHEDSNDNDLSCL